MPTHRWGDFTPSGHLGRILDDKTPQLGGTLDGNGFNFNGAVGFEAMAGEALTHGDAVYVSGVSGNKPVVMKADADDAAKMPAFGIAENDANLNANVEVITFGTVYNIDTSGWAIGDELYVSTTPGVLTSTPPTGATTKLQNIGKVIRSHAVAGSIKVGGAGRTNAVPNLDDGTVFIGDSNNQTEQRALVLADISDYTGGATATLDEVTTAGNTTTNSVTVGNLTSTGIDDNATSTALTIDSTGKITQSSSSNIVAAFSSTTTTAKLTLSDANDTAFIDVNATRLGIGHSSSTSTQALQIEPTSAEAMRIDSSGNVGIGTTSPSRELHVLNASGDAEIRVESTSSGGDGRLELVANSTGVSQIRFADEGSANIGLLTYDHSVDALRFNTNSSERMRIDSSGNVGIGTSDPQSKLDLWGTASPPTLTGHIRVHGGSATAKGGIEFINTSFESGYGWRVDAPDEGGGSTPIIFRSRSNSAAWTERMRIDSSGNVGIGTTDPASELEVAGTILASPIPYSANQDEAYLIAGTDGWTGANTNWNTFGFQHRIKTDSGGVPRVTIDNSGGEVFSVNNAGDVTITNNLTVDTTVVLGGGGTIAGATWANGLFHLGSSTSGWAMDPNELYNSGSAIIGTLSGDLNLNPAGSITTAHIISSTNNITCSTFTPTGLITTKANTQTNINIANDVALSVRSNGSAPAVMSFHRPGAYAVNFGLDGTNMKLGGWSASTTKFLWSMTNGDFHADGNVVAYSTTVSDERLKDDVQDITGALDTVDALRGVTYTWNAGSREGQRDYGVIAQEVEQVIPEIVHDTTMPLLGDEETVYKTVDYEKLCAVLISAVSELRAEVEELKNGN